MRRIVTAYDGQGNANLVTSYDASSGGNVVNQVKRDFNGLKQLTREWQEHNGAVTGSSASVQYAYSEMSGGANHSRLIQVTYASGYALNYNYGSGLDSTISRLTSLSDSGNTLESLTYLGLGTLVKRAHPQSGVDLTFIKLSGESTTDAGDQYTGLDRFDRIIDQRWINASNADVDRFKYGYDRNGNRTYKENVVLTGLSEVYSNDDLNQLSSFKLGTLNSGKTDVTGTPTKSQSWDYDATGNWDSITTNGVTQTRGANRQNEITSVSGATTPTYDNNGNLTKDENNYRFVYDAWNRQAKIKNSSDTVITTNEFDGLNRKIEVTASGVTTVRLFSTDWQVLEEKVGANYKNRYVWSPAYVDSLVTRDRDTDANGTLDERLFAQHDANFNVTAITNTSGTVQERYTPDPFGVVTFRDASGGTISASAKDWVFLHQGGQADILGHYDFRNRILSPTLGRWLTNDPLGFAAGDNNFYRYVQNEPLTSIDPDGLQSKEAQSQPQGKKRVIRIYPFWPNKPTNDKLLPEPIPLDNNFKPIIQPGNINPPPAKQPTNPPGGSANPGNPGSPNNPGSPGKPGGSPNPNTPNKPGGEPPNFGPGDKKKGPIEEFPPIPTPGVVYPTPFPLIKIRIGIGVPDPGDKRFDRPVVGAEIEYFLPW